MNFSYAKIALRIDDMTLRERGLMFAAGVMVLMMLPYSLVIDPALKTQRRLLDQIQKDQSQISSLGNEIRKLALEQSDAPNSVNREKLRSLDESLASVEKEIEASRIQLVPADRISNLLRGVLSKTGRVTLVSISAASGTPALDRRGSGSSGNQRASVGDAPATPAGANNLAQSAPPAQESAAVDFGLYRRGVQLVVRGNYLDLVQLLGELERLPWRMLWGKAELKLDQYPTVTLTVTLYTLSNDKAAVTL